MKVTTQPVWKQLTGQGSRARTARDELIGATVRFSGREYVQYGAPGGARHYTVGDRVYGQTGQVWGQADSTVLGSRRDRVYWIVSEQRVFAAFADQLEVLEATAEVLDVFEVAS